MLQPYIKRGRVASGTAAPSSRTSTSSSTARATRLILAGDHIYKMDYQLFQSPTGASRPT
jgi:ADP-glucose pyrophosphorylase